MLTALIKRAAPYKLSDLPYACNALEPYISKELLTLHHDGHHQAYVNGANEVEDKLYQARQSGSDHDIKHALKALSFNIAGIVMHDFYWLSMAPAGRRGKPGGAFGRAIIREFGSFERFKKEFNRAALGINGGGWAALAMGDITRRPTIMKIERYNLNVSPTFPVIMAIDVWEHAYDLDYKNDRAAYLDAVWNVINWTGIGKKWDDMMKWLPERES
jgi:superoxide dismutase, Fe-Mn family